MKKIITGLGIVLTALTLTLTNPTTIEAKTKYLTAKEAGKKIASLQKTAYEKKTNKTITLYVKAKSASGALKKVNKAYTEAARVQYGKAYRTNFKNAGNVCDYTRGPVNQKGFKTAAESWGVWHDYCINKVGNGKYRYKLTIKGKDKDFRFDYNEVEYQKKLINEVTSLTNGMNEFDKAYAVMIWLRNRSSYHERYHKDLTMRKLYERHYASDCDQLADLYAFFAKCAGVKHVGTVRHKTHMWNWIQVGKTKYYIDFQDGCPMRGNIKENIKELMDPLSDPGWHYLDYLNRWYKENVDTDAKEFNNCKEIMDSLTKEQREVFNKEHKSWDAQAKYELTCDTYSKIFLLPKEVYCSYDHPLKTYKEWRHVEY